MAPTILWRVLLRTSDTGVEQKLHRAALLDRETIHRIGGWIQSAQTPASVVRSTNHVAMCQYKSTYNQTKYLRLADRRALDCLRTTVGDARLGAAMGPNFKVAIPRRSRNLVQFRTTTRPTRR